MKRIRIGNDIRVQTSLHDLNDFDITSIKQLRCYFIPQGDSYTTPNDTYDPMQYNICNCGKPKYNVFPCNIDAPHWFCGYNGFGVNSKRFIHVDNKFLAPSRLLAEQNRIEAYFPAKAQYQIGEYKFVIVLTIYQPGWCEYNLRTITLDEGVIFALTSDDRDTDTDTIIDLDIPYITSITVHNKLTLEEKLQFNIGEQDYDDTIYSVILNYSDGSNKSITSDEFSNLISTSVYNGSGISVEENGQITRTDKFKDINTEIIYYLKEDPSIAATMQVVSAGKWHTINYVHPGVIKVEGPSELFVNKDYVNYKDDKIQLSSFTATKEPGATTLIMITGATGDGCTVKQSTQNQHTFDICTPITKDNITITITISTGFEDIPNVTSIVVPDKLTLEEKLQFNIGEQDYDDTIYSVILNYSDGSNKSITSDEFSNLISTSVYNGSGISVEENGQITRTDKFKDINTEIIYYLKEDPSIAATMQVVSAGKWHTINYVHPGVIKVEGPSELFVNKDYVNYKDDKIQLSSFTATKEPGATTLIMITGATGDGCTVKQSTQNQHTFDICTPITKDNITITITISTGFEDIPNVTSIVVPDKVVLQHTSHLNIGDLGYDGTAYNVRINYSDGSHKLVNADEFSKLITVVTGATGNITVAETGMIARLNMFENVDEQVTYQLKENPSIKDTMRIVSSGRMYRINYNYDSNYVTVNGNDSAYVDDTTKTGDALPVATFTVIPTNDEYVMTSLDMEITGASLSNKPDPNTSVTKAEVTIVTPVTLDEITVTITASQFRP